MDQGYEYQMDSIGGGSIDPDDYSAQPRPRRGRMSSRQTDAVSLGETRPLRPRLSVRSLQTDAASHYHQEAEYSSTQGSRGSGIRHSRQANAASNLQHSPANLYTQERMLQERMMSSDYSVASTDATTENFIRKGYISSDVPRKLAAPNRRRWRKGSSQQDTVSVGETRPSSRQRDTLSLGETRPSSRQQDTLSLGETRPRRNRLTTRSLQGSSRSLQSRPRRQEADSSSSQGSWGSAIRQYRQPAAPSNLQHALSFIPERMTASEYSVASSTNTTIDNLKLKGFSSGLARQLAANATAFANRIWVVDNSGSMVIPDGHRIVPTSNGNMAETRVSRWEELQDTILYHAEMAATLNSPTVFRLLNDPGRLVGPQELSVAQEPPGVGNVNEDIGRIRNVIQRAQPTGVTPLTSHILQIQHSLQFMAPRLRREGKRVAVILATDGLPTDEEGFGGDEITREFVQALKSLKNLPIWLVIRLCTDEKKVTDFYNSLDGKFDLSLEVLDDFLGEAHEVHHHNKWLNYSMTLHRCRELGYHDRLFDLIDERPLTRGELRGFCGLLFGYEISQIPDPNTDWREFIIFVQKSVALEPQQYSPIKKKVLPLIHVRTLNKLYGDSKCTVM